MKVAAILLAAGRSTRFGIADKLSESLNGLPLGLHAVRAMTPLPLIERFVVSGPTALQWPGFVVVENDAPEIGIARSIALGLSAAREKGADAVLIALADMPFVPTEHFRRLLACHNGPHSITASAASSRRMPPALFGAKWFTALEQLSGDHGARALLDRAAIVETIPNALFDIDRPQDLETANNILKNL